MKRRKAAVNAALLVAYLVSAVPALTGVNAHEWVGLAVMAMLLAHAASSLPAFQGRIARARSGESLVQVGYVVLDAALFVVLAVVVVSGVLVSGAVLPALGLYASGYYVWDPLHAIAAKVLFALMMVHVSVHISRIVRAAIRSNGEEPCDNKGEGAHEEVFDER